MNCEATSTASHSIRLMPLAPASSTRVSMCWRAWPNSWKIVSTSPKRMSARPFASGRDWLHTMSASGSSTVPSARRARVRNSFIQAPPDFVSGRE